MWLVEQVPHYRNIMYFESVFRPWLCIVFLHVLYQTQLEDFYIVSSLSRLYIERVCCTIGYNMIHR